MVAQKRTKTLIQPFDGPVLCHCGRGVRKRVEQKADRNIRKVTESPHSILSPPVRHHSQGDWLMWPQNSPECFGPLTGKNSAILIQVKCDYRWDSATHLIFDCTDTLKCGLQKLRLKLECKVYGVGPSGPEISDLLGKCRYMLLKCKSTMEH